ncbi:MAG: ATP-binding cassette domain-containing protein [Planctomycetes bacterium]|nr:ATP-binding cassette domain-containing protein [Planctomycetota bacterium]
MSDDTPAVSTTDLCRAFDGRTALGGVSLTIRRGELFGLLGPNGGGKTTLFQILATTLPFTSGRVSVLGYELPASAAQVRARIGVVFQAPSLDRFLTVGENLAHQGHLYGLRGTPLETRICECLELVQLTDRRKDIVGTLSGGMKRRVELAKGLLHEPGMLLLDEPTTGLDPNARRDLWDHLAALRDRGVTCLVTTHLLEEAERCDRIAILDRGRIVAEGTPEELRASIGGEVVTAVPRAAARLEPVRKAIEDCFRVQVRAIGGGLHIETKDGASLGHDLLRGFSRDLASVTIGKPTLEDVFLKATGRRLE